jgi:hypothetical protein
MNSLKTKALYSGIATAFAVAGLAAAIGTPLTGFASPNDGDACRAGYTPNFNGTVLTCRKDVPFGKVNLVCANSKFPTYVIRSGNGTGNDKDVCARSGVNIASAGPLPAKGDYDYATIDRTAVDSEITKMVQDEATALGLQISGVEWNANNAAGPLVGENSGAGGKDAVVYNGHFSTYPVKQ